MRCSIHRAGCLAVPPYVCLLSFLAGHLFFADAPLMKTKLQHHSWRARGRHARFLPIQCLVATALVAAASTAHAEAWFTDPGVHVAYGRDSSHNVNKYELGINFNTPLKYGNPDGWLLRVQAEVTVAGWQSRGGTDSTNLAEFGLTPILRLEKRGGYFVPFIEGGVGFRLLTHTHTSNEHDMSSAFQFGDMVGVGVSIGKSIETGFRFQHISNAGIDEPNPGANFYTGYVRYRF